MDFKAFISGCAGPILADAERHFFADVRPWGSSSSRAIVETPDQVRALTAAFEEAVERDDAPVLIDQEGGRVQRLRPPHWRRYPPARAYGDLYGDDPAAAARDHPARRAADGP